MSDQLSNSASRESVPDPFGITRWSLIVAAGEHPTQQSRAAFETLCASYWYPVYAFVRSRGKSREDAEDLTQGFLSGFMVREKLAGLDQSKGRFRAFLLASLKNYLANEWDKASTQKRGGGAVHVSFQWNSAEERFQNDQVDGLSADKMYDRVWALTLLENTLKRLEEEHDKQGKGDAFKKLKPFLNAESSRISYDQIASEMGTTPGAARVAVHRLRHRYRYLLRNEIVQTLSKSSDSQEEMRALFEALKS